MGLAIERISSLEQMKGIEADWRRLASGDSDFFLSWDWVCTFLENPPEDGKFTALVVRDGEAIVGIAPFWFSSRTAARIFPIRVLTIIGSRVVGADHLDFLTNEGRGSEVARVVWDYLYGRMKREWDVFEFRNTKPTSDVLKEFLDLSAYDKRCTFIEFQRFTICPFVKLPAGEEACLNLLSSGRRKELRRSIRRVEDVGEVRFLYCEDVSQFDCFFDQFVQLHQKSWTERGEDGAFARERFTRFHRELAKNLIPQKKFYLCNLYAGESHVASLHGFVHQNSFYFYQSAADRDLVHGINVGRIILAESIKWCAERGLNEFDMLKGDEAYKYEWTSTERRELSFDFFNSNLRSMFAQFAISVRQNLRMIYRSFVGRKNGNGR